MIFEADIYGVIIEILFILNIGIGFFLVSQTKKQGINNLYLGLIQILGAFSLSSTLFNSTNLYDLFPHLLGIAYPAMFLFGSLFFIYVKSLTDRDFRISYKIWFVLIIPVLAIIAYLPIYILPTDEKTEILNQMRYEQNWLKYDWVLFLIALLYNWIVLILNLKQILKYRDAIELEFSYIEKINLSYLYKEILFFCICWALISLLSFFNFSRMLLSVSINLSVIIPSILLVIHGYRGMLHLFKTIPQKLDNPVLSDKRKDDGNSDKFSIIKQEMEVNKHYLIPDLSLPELAEKTKFLRNELSEVINNQSGNSFYHFVNEYRISHFKQLLQNIDLKGTTILDLAYESGFNSKSAFYNAFKRVTGLTPKKYLITLESD